MSNLELLITDVVVGTGKVIQKGALVLVNYTGRLSNDSIFDSSYDRGRPFQFVYGTGRVIKGWDLGLAGMKEGGRRNLFVPAHLAYGERQIGALITANSDLFFEVELIEVRPRED